MGWDEMRDGMGWDEGFRAAVDCDSSFTLFNSTVVEVAELDRGSRAWT